MSIQNPYDHALKILARTYPAEFLQLGFPDKSVRLLEGQDNVELAMEIDRVDFLQKIELQGTTAFMHIDFQTSTKWRSTKLSFISSPINRFAYGATSIRFGAVSYTSLHPYYRY